MSTCNSDTSIARQFNRSDASLLYSVHGSVDIPCLVSTCPNTQISRSHLGSAVANPLLGICIVERLDLEATHINAIITQLRASTDSAFHQCGSVYPHRLAPAKGAVQSKCVYSHQPPFLKITMLNLGMLESA